jgi:hypothetical protein
MLLYVILVGQLAKDFAFIEETNDFLHLNYDCPRDF